MQQRGADPRYVFSTDLYIGNGGLPQIISNGLDMLGHGGLVWIKNRDAGLSHTLADTERGANEILSTNTTAVEATEANTITSFNDNGYTVGSDDKVTANNDRYVSWSFRRAPRFFDIVTYTGDGVAGREITHRLRHEPGMMVVKRLDAVSDWPVYHRDLAAANYLALNGNDLSAASTLVWNDTAPTYANFTVGDHESVNALGGEYVAYLWAHDDTAVGAIKTGSYVGQGETPGFVETGWPVQWLLIKSASTSAPGAARDWVLLDNVRQPGTSRDAWIEPNSNSIEQAFSFNVNFSSTGFTPSGISTLVNHSGANYVYMAIRAEGA